MPHPSFAQPYYTASQRRIKDSSIQATELLSPWRLSLYILLLALWTSEVADCTLEVDNCPKPTTIAAEGNLETLIREVELQALELSSVVQRSFKTRCSVLGECACSPDMCADGIGSTVCSTHAGLGRGEACAEDNCDGFQVNLEQSTVNRVNTGPVQRAEAEAICATKALDETFRAQYRESIMWSYLGTYNGIWRVFPGNAWDCDRRYDPRVRPWYRGAASGPKDLILVVDNSGSMEQVARVGGLTRLDILKKALNGDPETGKKGLLDMLTHHDNVGIVTFNSEARILGSTSQLLEGNEMNIQELKAEVEKVQPEGDTSLVAGFDSAFQLLHGRTKKNCNSYTIHPKPQ